MDEQEYSAIPLIRRHTITIVVDESDGYDRVGGDYFEHTFYRAARDYFQEWLGVMKMDYGISVKTSEIRT